MTLRTNGAHQKFVERVARACKRVDADTEFRGEYQSITRWLLYTRAIRLTTPLTKAKKAVFDFQSGPVLGMEKL